MRRLCLGAAVAMGIAAGCNDSKKSDDDPKQTPAPAEVEGLAAVPADARVVVGVDVPALASSVLVSRAIEGMWQRDPELKNRIDGFIGACKLDPAEDVSSLVIGMGDGEHVIMVATGSFVESEIALCIEEAIKDDGGRLVTSTAGGRTVYKVDSGADKAPVWFAFGSKTTFLVSSSESFLGAALGDGPKAPSNEGLADLIAKARVEGAAVWGAGTVPPKVGAGLVRASGGKAAAPSAMFGHIRLGDGISAELGAVMGSAKEAKELVSFGKSHLNVIALGLAKERLTELVQALQLQATDSTALLRLSLSHNQLAELLERIDTGAPDAQNPSLDATAGAPRNDEADAAGSSQEPVRQQGKAD